VYAGGDGGVEGNRNPKTADVACPAWHGKARTEQRLREGIVAAGGEGGVKTMSLNLRTNSGWMLYLLEVLSHHS
jgi:hypothetical protein